MRIMVKNYLNKKNMVINKNKPLVKALKKKKKKRK